MYSDNDLVNAYMQKQAEYIKDAVTKNIMLETKLNLTESAHKALLEENTKLKERLAILQPETAPRPGSEEGKEFARKKSRLQSGEES